MTNLVITKEFSQTIDVGSIKDEKNRLERPREVAVGVRHCRHILQGFVTKVCTMAHSNSHLSWPLKPVLLIFDGFHIYGPRAFFCNYQICH